jgi:hypothetical protein
LLFWAEGTRFAFRVDGASAPEFHAWVEDCHFDSDGPGTLLSVGIGSKPRLAFRLAATVKDDEAKLFASHANPVCSVVEFDSPMGPNGEPTRVEVTHGPATG